MDIARIPFFDELRHAKSVLIAGMGGGFDIYSGLPLYCSLRSAGKTVHVANLSFTSLLDTDARELGGALYEVTAETHGPRYFPEVHLARWLHATRGEKLPVYCVARTGVRPVRDAYRDLVAHLGGVDAIVLVDGGTDSLMRGDEAGLGTPQEDMASLCAVAALESVATKLLACIGFGVDTYHGVCHAHFLEAVAELTRTGAFLGAWSVTPAMPEAEAYRAAVEWVHRHMPERPSIVCTSIASAIEGQFGDYHANPRTKGSDLFINPLMSMYWAFRIDGVMQRHLYASRIAETESYSDLSIAIERFRYEMQKDIKRWQDLPM